MGPRGKLQLLITECPLIARHCGRCRRDFSSCYPHNNATGLEPSLFSFQRGGPCSNFPKVTEELRSLTYAPGHHLQSLPSANHRVQARMDRRTDGWMDHG